MPFFLEGIEDQRNDYMAFLSCKDKQCWNAFLVAEIKIINIYLVSVTCE